MTLDDAIEKHKKMKKASELHNDKRGAFYTAEEHEQLAEWLEELKDYRDKNKMVVRIDTENMDSIKDKIEELSKYAERQYNKALDDFVNACKEDILCQSFGLHINRIEKIAEQLKEMEDK